MNMQNGQISLDENSQVVVSSVKEELKPLHQQREFWESIQTQPFFKPTSQNDYFENHAAAYLKKCMEHPFLSVKERNDSQFKRLVEIVTLAYEEIPVYREKYQQCGFHPSQLKSLADYAKIPVITKRELIKAFPDGCLNPRFKREELFPTRSSGSSGETLLIRVDEEAILKDTIQGLRQFALQSGLKYSPNDLLAHVYTVPWWFDAIGDKYKTAFISNVIPPRQVSLHLGELSPQILSCYPSNLEALLPYSDAFKNTLYLAVTHSEYSTKYARMMWSKLLGCPVLDEYSSEEATRIALELPCGHYHVCDDAVFLEVVDETTFMPKADGTLGLSVVTNLLNEAMPFIRYVQGDLITRPKTAADCMITWSQIESLDGRQNDSFINEAGRLIPSGSILDITYRWMFDCNVHLDRFELVQKEPSTILAQFIVGSPIKEAQLFESIAHLETLLALCFEHTMKVKPVVVSSFPATPGKRRPLRCEVPKWL